jgi:hypothetical protein
VGATVGAFVGSYTSVAMGEDFRPLIQIMDNMTDEEKENLVKVAKKAALDLGIDLALDQVPIPQDLLKHIFEAAGFSFKK